MDSEASRLHIHNLTRDVAIAPAGRLANSFWARLRGLMGAPGLPEGGGLVIMPCSSIHTQFMRFAIDVLYVTRDHTVVGIDRNLKPWRFGRFYKEVHYVIELPAGGAAACEIGDQIALRPTP